MSLNDIVKMLGKMDEQKRSLTSLGSIATMLNKTLDNQHMLGLGQRLSEINKPIFFNHYKQFGGLNNILKDVFPKNIMTSNGIAAVTSAAISGITNNRFAIETLSQRSYIENTLGKQFGIINQLNAIKPIGLSAIDYGNYRNIFQSMTSLTTKIAVQGLSGGVNENYYENVRDTTNNVSSITETVLEQNYVSKDDIERLHNLIITFKCEVLNRLDKKDLKSNLSLWIGFIGLLFTLFPIFQKSFEDPDSNLSFATAKQVTDLKNDLHDIFRDSLNYNGIIRYTNRRCKVFLNPSLRSQVIAVVSKGKRISIINSSKKWVLVTLLDSDGFPISGWVLKKYLSKGLK